MYEPVIGLEIHCQLKTKSKMFCSCDNDAEGKEPNTVTCPVCMGHPGTLPVANRQALEWTYLLGLALGCQISPQFNFERKQYFYPDLPKAYQITSQTTPPLVGGELEIDSKTFTIEHIHLEEDAGKLIHAGDYSLVDLNRAGTPLLEIVTNPCFSTPQEAKTFMQELRLILRYLDISDADMEKGHLRCDANISVRPVGQKELGKKAEVKNMNSFASVEKALAYEIKRQTEILEEGGKVTQETRGWDEAKQKTFSQRSKEQAHDYRYFPEPDLPPLRVGNDKSQISNHKQAFDLEELKRQIPELPAEKRERYGKDFGLNEKDTEVFVGDIDLAGYFETAVETIHELSLRKKTASLLLTDVLGYLNANNQTIADFKIKPTDLADLASKIESGEISSKIAKDVFAKMAESGRSADEIISAEGIKQISDIGELEKIIQEIIAANPGPVAQYRAGKTEILGFFVGQVMKVTRGQANPEVVMEVLRKKMK
ncbi:Asp-tRNA(Asn)/Glu-tRNA(Gln) amidotransferase subunit GatB [Candidatus Microgenomates bacterium]|nr:Asp-tRNA(Asn)/Glu-tRNA(Gln) amidotransferase subunit GatB [Candidatus Microgenomates bacterium]